ncbi:NAD(P)/FAD-dependent oxidoreductase [Glycomyces buryatensis]|uniref:Oxidoreductase n=1 Tax=Glycomyces buryatensis TaxID=2570927 RepID=A0A4S8Q1Q7_9ACTN|nr:FAD-dependent oxidoreductase [Glycomyces buryatensis]THV37031.1 oxidoreductase [Glycomyces buryatensis]
MQHRIVVLGAGYAGAYIAGNLARSLAPTDREITVVNAEPDFVERLRLHQVAAGQDIKRHSLTEVFRGTDIRIRLARVESVDVEAKTVALSDGELPYDTLVYALGSRVADHGVPGVVEHAFHVTSSPAAQRLREHLDGLDFGGKVLVVGEGLTGIETVTELAESRPELQVAMAARGELGASLSPGAQRHLRQAFDRLGIEVHEHTSIERVEQTRAIGADGTVLESDATVWAAGFAVDPIAAASGLEVADTGQILVDREMRSVSHPDVYSAGDAVYILGDNGLPLPMSCASSGFTAKQAIEAIVGDLTGHKVSTSKLPYVGNHISLGRNDAIFQLVDEVAHSKSWSVRGKSAVRIKAAILKGSIIGTLHPTFGMPKRKHRLQTSSKTTEAIAA